MVLLAMILIITFCMLFAVALCKAASNSDKVLEMIRAEEEFKNE